MGGEWEPIQRATPLLPLGGCLGGWGVEWGAWVGVEWGSSQQVPNSWPRAPNRGLLPPSPATKHIFCLFLESPDVTLGQRTTRPQEMRRLSLALTPQSQQLMRELLDARGGEITLVPGEDLLFVLSYFGFPRSLSHVHNSLLA